MSASRRRAAVYRRPSVRAFRVDDRTPTAVVIHRDRIVAHALRLGLRGQLQVVGDTVFGAVALQLADLLTPSVVIAGDMVDDGPIEWFLPSLVETGAHVLVVADSFEPAQAFDMLGRGASGLCRTDEGVEALCDAVRVLGMSGTRLPPDLLSLLIAEWRIGRRAAGSGGAVRQLTGRELEVLDAMADGLATKAVARRLGLSAKTVEHYKTRIFGKLGVRSQAEAVAAARTQVTALRAVE